jgi:hypothetical protein
MLENLAVFLIMPNWQITVSHLTMKMEIADLPEYRQTGPSHPLHELPPFPTTKEANVTVLTLHPCV